MDKRGAFKNRFVYSVLIWHFMNVKDVKSSINDWDPLWKGRNWTKTMFFRDAKLKLKQKVRQKWLAANHQVLQPSTYNCYLNSKKSDHQTSMMQKLQLVTQFGGIDGYWMSFSVKHLPETIQGCSSASAALILQSGSIINIDLQKSTKNACSGSTPWSTPSGLKPNLAAIVVLLGWKMSNISLSLSAWMGFILLSLLSTSS